MRGKAAVRIAVLCVLACVCVSCGPRMVTQISEKPYKTRMPDAPTGTVPTSGRAATLAQEQSALEANPVPRTAETLDDGRIYYGYYCLMCHGKNGDGNGPVGQSYVPKPRDLTAPAVVRLSDGQLYDRMLHGPGHDPVMLETVIPEHRWPLVHYIRSLPKTPDR